MKLIAIGAHNFFKLPAKFSPDGEESLNFLSAGISRNRESEFDWLRFGSDDEVPILVSIKISIEDLLVDFD